MFKIKLNETGRSMVEMLGVLAIIGVLSVAGVATYQYTLTAYQAGKVQDVLGKAKTLAQTDSRASHALEVNRFIKSALAEYTPDDKKSMVKFLKKFLILNFYSSFSFSFSLIFSRLRLCNLITIS